MSAGGFTALRVVLGALPADFPLPILVVQHRAATSTKLGGVLQPFTPMPIVDAVHDVLPRAGHIYLAPPDQHLRLIDGRLRLDGAAPVLYSRPSVDVLFESVAEHCGARAIAVVLTGANSDGALGLRAIAAAGGTVIVQDPATAESRLMPDAALRLVPQAEVLPLERIAERLAAAGRAAG